MYVDSLMPSYIAAFDPLAGTPPVYQIIDGMTFTDWSCYRYVSLSFLVIGGREDSVNCYVCEPCDSERSLFGGAEYAMQSTASRQNHDLEKKI